MTVTGSLLLVLLLPGLGSLLPLLEAVQVLLLTSGQHLQEDGVLSSVIQTWGSSNYIITSLFSNDRWINVYSPNRSGGSPLRKEAVSLRWKPGPRPWSRPVEWPGWRLAAAAPAPDPQLREDPGFGESRPWSWL